MPTKPAATNRQSTVRETIDSPPTTLEPVCTVHGKDWYKMPYQQTQELNGPIHARQFGIRTAAGTIWRYGFNVDSSISRLDVFLEMFPGLHCIWTSTNIFIRHNNQRGNY
jgi:hypothetical protein